MKYIKTFEEIDFLPVLGVFFLVMFLIGLFRDLIKKSYPNILLKSLTAVVISMKSGKLKPNINKYFDQYTIELEAGGQNVFVRFDEDYNNVSLSTLNRKTDRRYKLNIDLKRKVISRMGGKRKTIEVSDSKIEKIIEILDKIKQENENKEV